MKNDFLDKIKSNDYLEQIAGLDELVVLNNEISSIVIEDFKNAETKVFIAERILMIISSYTNKLLHLAESTDNEELKFLAYFTLCKIKVYDGLDYLVDYLSKIEDYGNALYAIRYLAKLKADGIIPVIKKIIKVEESKKRKWNDDNGVLIALYEALVDAC